MNYFVGMSNKNTKSLKDENKLKCGPGTHYDIGTNSCLLDEKEE